MAAVNGIGSAAVLQSLNIAATSVAPETVAAKFSGTTAVIAAAVTDKTNVSSTAGLVSAALNTSDVRLDKVTALQAAISSGTYSVSSGQVASKIVDSLLK